MAIFAGKFVYVKAYELQFRVFLKPWETKIIVRCCSNLGEGSTDFPVRYIPKKSSKWNNPNDSSPVTKDSENLESLRFTDADSSNLKSVCPAGNLRSKVNKIRNSAGRLEVRSEGNSDGRLELRTQGYNRRSVEFKCVEELHEFDADEHTEEVLDELDSDNGKYEIKHLALEPGKTGEEAEKTAIGLLAARAYTALELKKKLTGKKFSLEVINAVISDFQNRGLINDFLYAEAFSRSRWSSSSWGPRRIKQALAKKGVNDSDAQRAIKSVLEDGEHADDQVSNFGLSKPSMDHLFSQASKQWLRAKDLPLEKQKSRIISWLQYRGFNWGIITYILKKLQSEHPP